MVSLPVGMVTRPLLAPIGLKVWPKASWASRGARGRDDRRLLDTTARGVNPLACIPKRRRHHGHSMSVTIFRNILMTARWPWYSTTQKRTNESACPLTARGSCCSVSLMLCILIWCAMLVVRVSVFWWKHIVALTTALRHHVLWIRHGGHVHADDWLWLSAAQTGLAQASIANLLLVGLGVPLSWHKLHWTRR